MSHLPKPFRPTSLAKPADKSIHFSPVLAKLFMNTEITTDGACPGTADIEEFLKELAAIRADMVV